MRLARPLVVAGVGLALADASVVTLALPELIVELDTTVEGVAAVLGVYTLVLAAALIPAERLRRQVGSTRLGAWGFIVFAAAGAGCGLVDSLTPLLVLRGAAGARRGRRAGGRVRVPHRRRARQGAAVDRGGGARGRRRARARRASHRALRLARDLPGPGSRRRPLGGGVARHRRAECRSSRRAPPGKPGATGRARAHRARARRSRSPSSRPR